MEEFLMVAPFWTVPEVIVRLGETLSIELDSIDTTQELEESNIKSTDF